MNIKLAGLLSTAAALGLWAGGASAQNLINSNTSIHSSLCVGFDCATTESYGSDTIRLKENNLRIHFDDTSSTGSFPNRDWRLTANDSTNGGANKFSIDDATGNTTPFTIEAATPSHTLYVDSTGRIGNGTSTPVTQIHTRDGNTPTLRLEQDGSSGFAAQTWDLAGNETSFFIRDATNGSTLPFRIFPGAASQALVIDGNSDVGIGAGTNPAASLHVKRSDGTARLKVEETNATGTARTVAEFINNGRPDLVLANSSTSDEWSIGGGTNMVMKAGALGSDPSAKTTHFTLTNAGNLTITGTLTTGGTTCGGGCDLVFSDGYDLPSVKDHAQAMFALGYLPNVGPTIENQPINVSDKLGRMLNELEHAHIYIAELHDEIETLKSRSQDEIALMRKELDTLRARLDTD